MSLKVEKALPLMHNKGSLSDEESTNTELALITKGIKRFWKGKDIGGNESSNNRGTPVEVFEDTVCYTCGEKGHITRNYTKKKVETALKKDKA